MDRKMKTTAYYFIHGILFSIFVVHGVHGTCVDNNTLCSTWIQSGFCTNTYYTCENLLDYCSLSCNVASCNPQTTCTQSAAPPAPVGPPSSSVVTCADSDSMCSDWVTSGFCNNTYYTCAQKQQYCALSCNIGSCSPQATCTGGGGAPVGEDSGTCPPDNNTLCSSWASAGFCSSAYYNCTVQMSYCATTCNIAACSGNTPTPCTGSVATAPPVGGPPANNGPCTDSSTNCLNWQANGFCTNNFYTCDYKQSYCAATCNIQACSPTYTACSGTTGCNDLSPRCAAWASSGFCQNPFYDDSYRCGYCPSTCGLCTFCANATTAAPGTAAPPVGTTPAPAGGTTAVPAGTTPAPAGGTTAKGGTSAAAPIETTPAPAGGTTAKAGTTAKGGTSAAPAGTTPAAGGTTAKGGTSAAPAGGTTAKGGTSAAPAGGTTAKAGTTAAPAGGTTAKGGTSAAPAGTTAAPAGGTTAKAGTTAKGGGTSAAPAGTTAAPAGGTTAKAGTTAKGGGTSAAPAGTTAAPAGGTTAKAGTTAKGGGTSAAPAGTTAAPAGGTSAAPAGTTAPAAGTTAKTTKAGRGGKR